jgi:hypothetical protein
MAAAFWLNEVDDWLGPFTQPELVELLAERGYRGDAFSMADPTLVVLGPDLGCMFVESLMSVDGEHLYRCREVAA